MIDNSKFVLSARQATTLLDSQYSVKLEMCLKMDTDQILQIQIIDLKNKFDIDLKFQL